MIGLAITSSSPYYQLLFLFIQLFRTIPKDFVPANKEVSNLSKKELEHRFAHWTGIDARPKEDGYGSTPMDVDWGIDTFQGYLFGLKKVVDFLAGVSIDEYFSQQFEIKYPDFRFADGRKIRSMQDFILYLNTYCGELSTEESRKKVREMTYFVVYGMFPSAVAKVMEDAIMNFLGLDYAPELSDGSKKARIHTGGFVKDMIVRKKTAMGNGVRATYGKVFLEELFVRDNFTPCKDKIIEAKLLPAGTQFVTYPQDWDALLQNEEMSSVTSAWDDAEKKKWRIQFQKAAKSRYLVKATYREHAFNGLILLTEGNPQRLMIDNPTKSLVKPAEQAPQATDGQAQDALIEWITAQIKGGKVTTKRDFLSIGLSESCSGQPDKLQAILGGSGKPIKIVAGRTTSPVSASSISHSAAGSSDDETTLTALSHQEAADEFGANPMEVSASNV